jgi:hypothetical protein
MEYLESYQGILFSLFRISRPAICFSLVSNFFFDTEIRHFVLTLWLCVFALHLKLSYTFLSLFFIPHGLSGFISDQSSNQI